MRDRLFVFTEGETDKIFFNYLISTLFKNANKKMWPKECLIIESIDGIGNANKYLETYLDDIDDFDSFNNIVVFSHDTDVFEYQRKPPINIEKISSIIKSKFDIEVIELKIVHNIEDLIVFSKAEIIKFLQLDADYKLNKRLSGIEQLKDMFKSSGKFYVKGSKSEDLIKCLNFSSIAKKYCSVLKPLCTVLNLDCDGLNCKIKRK